MVYHQQCVFTTHRTTNINKFKLICFEKEIYFIFRYVIDNTTPNMTDDLG